MNTGLSSNGRAEQATLLLARHAQTQWNVEGLCQSHRDVPLNEAGRAMAAALAGYPALEGIAAIYSSDLCRAWQTAEAVSRRLGLPVRTDARLREIRKPPEPSEAYPELPFPVERETPEQVGERLEACLCEIAGWHVGERVLVVSHGGAIRWFLARVLGASPVEAALTHRVSVNTAVSHLRCEPRAGRWEADRLFDAEHLAGEQTMRETDAG